jgi:hypothetical protein
VHPFASVAVTVKEKLPEAEGVPDKTPPEESERPPGRVPLVTLNAYGAVPPEAVIVWLYADPTDAAGNEPGRSVIAGQLTVSV